MVKLQRLEVWRGEIEKKKTKFLIRQTMLIFICKWSVCWTRNVRMPEFVLTDSNYVYMIRQTTGPKSMDEYLFIRYKTSYELRWSWIDLIFLFAALLLTNSQKWCANSPIKIWILFEKKINNECLVKTRKTKWDVRWFHRPNIYSPVFYTDGAVPYRKRKIFELKLAELKQREGKNNNNECIWRQDVNTPSMRDFQFFPLLLLLFVGAACI